MKNDPSLLQEEHKKIADLLRQLTGAHGPSGYETSAAKVVKDRLRPWAEEVFIDRLGSVVAYKKASRPYASARKVLLAAHLDEIGLLITSIDPEGYLRFTNIGGIDPRVLLGQEVLIHSSQKPGRMIPGIIGAKPPHYQSPQEQESVIPLADLYIDTGQKGPALKRAVAVGDAVTLAASFSELQNGRAATKALDDRICCAAMIRTLEHLATLSHPWDIYAVATSQEEAGLGFLGAATSAFRIKPDLALVLDVTHADMPLAPEHRTFSLAKGPVIAIGPNFHPAIAQRLMALARRLEIPHQIEPLAGNSGTDAVDIQIAGSGIPTGLIGIPVRYMHTPVETANLADIERVARLLAAFISQLDQLDLAWKD